VCFQRAKGDCACDTLFKYALCSWVRTEPIHSSIISPCVSLSAAGSYSLSGMRLHSINHQCLACALWSRTVKSGCLGWRRGNIFALKFDDEFAPKEEL
jgi:hypothetical protein